MSAVALFRSPLPPRLFSIYNYLLIVYLCISPEANLVTWIDICHVVLSGEYILHVTGVISESSLSTMTKELCLVDIEIGLSPGSALGTM